MMTRVIAATWPVDSVEEAVAALARMAAVAPDVVAEAQQSAPGTSPDDPAQLRSRIEHAAERLGLEAEPVETSYRDAGAMLRSAAPALLLLHAEDETRLLLLRRSRGDSLQVITPSLQIATFSVAAVREHFCRATEALYEPTVEHLLRLTRADQRRERVRRALLDQLSFEQRIGGCWLLRVPSSAGAAAAIGTGRLAGSLGSIMLSHAAHYLLWVASWVLVGWMTLAGGVESEWLIAWALALLSLVPFRVFTLLQAGRLSITCSTWLRRRLLAGALRMNHDQVRTMGVGQLLGRSLDTEVLEQTALYGGFLALTASLEIVVAVVVLALGAGGVPHALLLVLWVIFFTAITRYYLRRREDWTAGRLHLTEHLVEQMVGHRTRLLQQPAGAGQEAEEDASLESYLNVSRTTDRSWLALEAVVPRGWIIVGLAGMAPAFQAGTSTASLAISIGGVLMAYRALRGLAIASEQITAAQIAWKRVQPFFAAARAPEVSGSHRFRSVPPVPDPTTVRSLLEATDLQFRYPDRTDPVLRGLDLRVCTRDRILLEGLSGSGKSTLGALLARARHAGGGLLLLHGLDPETWGDATWRRRVALVPQFHENHVVMGTLAFNLLLSRDTPASEEALQEATHVCHALGLGPLLERMPAGMMQMVGETGWQLSHGERSRLFIARALLQRPDVIILDESVAALDPETLCTVTRELLKADVAIILIAHP